MVQKILDRIARCSEPALLKRWIENAVRQGNMTVERAECLVSKKPASTGFHMLLEYDLPDLTFEALVLKQPDQFDEADHEAARVRLEGADIRIAEISQSD